MLEDIIQKIASSTQMKEEEIIAMIEEKKKHMPGISQEGLARIVAKELGVNLYQKPSVQVKIAHIIPNMRNISVIAKVVEVNEIREFEGGRVQNIILADETGKIRLSLWNDEIEKFALKENEVIKVENCIARKGLFESAELRLGFSGSIERVSMEIKTIEPINKISEAKENVDLEIECKIIDVFERYPIYKFCSVCRTKVSEKCEDHLNAPIDKALIISAIIDDGTGSIRAVFFREQAEKLFGKTLDEIEEMLEGKALTELAISLGIMDKKYKVSGLVRRNRITEELEIVVKEVKEIGS